MSEEVVLSKQDTIKKIITIYIDIKGSSIMENINDKKLKVQDLYKMGRDVKDYQGVYKVDDITYLGDGIILFMKANSLNKNDLVILLDEISEKINGYENNHGKILKVGIAYGMYDDVSVPFKDIQVPKYVSPAFDFSCKASNLARTTSILEKFVVKGNANNVNLENSLLIKKLKEIAIESNIHDKESKKSKNYRFNWKDNDE